MDLLNANAWVVPWAMWGWGVLIAAMLVFEIYTLWWNGARGDGHQRANLTAYVMAFFGRKRSLRYRAPAAVLVATFVFFLGHFMGWW